MTNVEDNISMNSLALKIMSGLTKCSSITKPGGVVSTEADWVIIQENLSKFEAQRIAFREHQQVLL